MRFGFGMGKCSGRGSHLLHGGGEGDGSFWGWLDTGCIDDGRISNRSAGDVRYDGIVGFGTGESERVSLISGTTYLDGFGDGTAPGMGDYLGRGNGDDSVYIMDESGTAPIVGDPVFYHEGTCAHETAFNDDMEEFWFSKEEAEAALAVDILRRANG